MPKIDIAALDWVSRTGYPEPFRALVEGRARRRLGEAGGLKQFGVNLTRIPPGCASSQRHWHENEDEFVFILDGEAALVEDGGETLLRAGDAAAFKAGVANGHHLVNRGRRDLLFLEIGSRAGDERVHYPDVDLAYTKDAGHGRFIHKSGADYD